ncbi:PC-esterase domain-containing protein 1B [Sorex fumeus]|uniref:PC-esterase domain-containing protein 1B n=1 Tax=Sorex fumeus TaxID=62283 RepID=UPI0024AE1F46|nr:PC-esterase domain-containing protein 1B [Sorex fumeus]
MVHLRASEVRQLLHNKFVVVLGDSVQRAVYKDLVLLLQKDCLLTTSQLKAKGEESFEQDELVLGGQQLPLHNGTHYREVRQFRSAHHLVRFYFLTRVYSDYLQEVLEQLRSGEHAPDLVIMNSCLWDLSRYGPSALDSYLQNLERLFEHLDQVLPASCLVVWNTALPVAEHITAGVLPPKHQAWSTSLRTRVLEANFYSSSAAGKRHFDVLDLHFHFRHAHQYRQLDGVHWNQRAHRQLTQLLLAHVADAWGVDLPQRDPVGKWIHTEPARETAAWEGARETPAWEGARETPAWEGARGTPAWEGARETPAWEGARETPAWEGARETPAWEGARQPPVSPYPPPPAFPQPLLPVPPSPPRLPWPPLEPCPPPPRPPMMPPWLFGSQEAYSALDCPFPPTPTPFSPGHFHSDTPLPAQPGFPWESDFVFDPRPPTAPFPPPCHPPPPVHRGYPRPQHPRGPYAQWRQRPRPFKRKSQAHPGPRPQ